MRSLFLKIFLWFWLAMTLIGAIGVVLVLTIDLKGAELARHRKLLRQDSRTLVAAYQAGGEGALLAKARQLEHKSGTRAYLFQGLRGPLGGEVLPTRVLVMEELAARTGEVQFLHGRHGFWIARPVAGDYTFVAKLPPPNPLERFFNPRRIGLRLIVTFVVAGTVCYLLALSLTAPIRKLREATQRFAAGDLSTRVGGEIPGRGEFADLGRDFDRMAERIQGLMTGQQQLLRDVSHELRSPLARLNVALELARQRAGEPASGALDRIEREAERLNEMIGELLSLHQLESSIRELPQLPVELQSLVQAVVEDAAFEAAKLQRSVVLVEAVPIVTRGSAELLRRAVENVVRNAVHYTADGTVVEVVLRQQDEGALLRVRDHGPGVPAAALEKIFQPFYRVGDARDRSSGGTGIGLAIAERAVRLHGGRVRAVNAPAGGLVVEITLPTTGNSLPKANG